MATHVPTAFDLSSFSKVKLTGKDRSLFLQNFTTNDVVKPGVGFGCETFLTTAQARIVAWLRVAIRSADLYLNMEPGLASKVITHLDRFVIGEDVQFEDRTEVDFLWLLNDPAMIDGLELWQQQENVWNDPALTLQRCDFLGKPAAFLWGPMSSRDAASAHLHTPLLSTEDPLWNSMRLEAGTPAYGVDFDESNLPQEVNRTEQAISFTKGCYIGQETVARIRAYGHVNKQLKRVQFAGEMHDPTGWSGASLQAAGKEVGKLKTVAWSPAHSTLLGFAIVRKEQVAAGTLLQAVAGDKTASVTVL